MAAKTPKLYRAQFLITKPARKNVKVQGISSINFYLAFNEEEVRDHVTQLLEKIREQNNNDSEIFIKHLNIKMQKMNSLYNLTKK